MVPGPISSCTLVGNRGECCLWPGPILGELDPDLPLTRAMTMDEMVRDSTASRRFTLVLLGVFAGVALVLALAGLYGVISDSVNQRAP